MARRTLRERFAAVVTPSGTATAPRGEKGRSGTVNTGGFITQNEINSELLWPRNIDVYEEMRSTDPNVRWQLALVSTPIRSAARTIEPASDDSLDQEIAAFVDEALFNHLDGGFDEFLRQALEYPTYGHFVFERIADLREVEFTWTEESMSMVTPNSPQEAAAMDDLQAAKDSPTGFATKQDVKDAAAAGAAAAGAAATPIAAAPPVLDPIDGKVKPMPGVVPPHLAPHLGVPGVAPPPPKPKPVRERLVKKASREAFVVSRLSPRMPRTIHQWNVKEKDPSQLESITQWIGDGKTPDTVDIPADRLVVFIHDKQGDDWRGISLLRTAYKAWLFKERLENLEAIAYERSAGFPVVYPPDNATATQLDAIEEMLMGIRQGEQVWGIMPGPKADAANPEGWLLEDVNVKADGSATPDAAITRYEATMARNILAEFMRLGHENTGARATADVQQDPYWQAIEAYAGYIEDVINASVIRPLVDWNYETTSYPEFKFSKLQAENVIGLGQNLSALITAGGLTATPELEDWIRKQLDAPEKPLEMEQEAVPPSGPNPPPPDGAPEPGTGPAPGTLPDAGEPGGGPQIASEPPAKPAPKPAKPMAMGERFTGEIFPHGRGWLPGEDSIAFAQIRHTLDNATDDLVEIVSEVIDGQVRSQKEVADRAVELNKPEMLDAIALDPMPLADAIERRLIAVHEEGINQIRGELRRQLDQPETQALKIPASVGDATRALKGFARATAEEAVTQAQRALKVAALRQITQKTAPASVAPGGDPLAAARQTLREASSGLVNRAFALGRVQALTDLSDRFDHYTYTATLDENACGPCTDADGTEAQSIEEIDPEVPNPECEGGDRCRCIWLGYASRGGGAGGAGYE